MNDQENISSYPAESNKSPGFMNQKADLAWNELHSKYFKFVQRNELCKVQEVFKTLRQDFELFVPILKNSKLIVNQFVLKKSGDTALHICARLGPSYLELFRYLVEEEGANIEQLNNEGKTALHDAAQFCNIDAVQYLLQHGANVNVVKKADWTPLMLAATKYDNVDVVRLLLSAGTDPYFVNKDGWNAVHLAARVGNVHIVKMLLELENLLEITAGNAINRTKLSQTKSNNGRRPLHTAVMHRHVDVTQLLVKECTLDEVNAPDHCGTTPLMDSCRFGHIDILSYLLNSGGNLYQVNQQGQNCLHISAEAGQTSVVDELVTKHGMDVTQPSQDNSKMIPLHWAAKEGHVGVIVTLLNVSPHVTLQDDKGRTALDLAKLFGYDAAAQILLDHQNSSK